MKRLPILLSVLILLAARIPAADTNSPFRIRGTLPWHNFLSGPTAWNEEDYVRYLDRMQALGLNYLTFHCYTGGAERYVSYVEPLLRIEYRNVLPEAALDTSLTARWGYRPLAVAEFAFGTDKLFKLPPGAQSFGSDAAVLARDNADRYRRAQDLMQRVVRHAHRRGIQVGMGFEFGIHPPEFFSVVPADSWIRGANLPDPFHPASIEILHRTLDNLLTTYPEIDWIWLWLHEHTMHVGQPRVSAAFSQFATENAKFFSDAGSEANLFTGLWSLAYLREAQDYLQRRAPKVRLAISGWGGGAQLPLLLRGLDRALPTNIVFTCLNPAQGWEAQPPVMAEIAAHREVWAIPWLEGDARLWHLQPRVNLLRDQVRLAHQQKLGGVLAIHWRTEETRANLDAFARFAADPTNAPGVEEFYRRDCEEQFGRDAAQEVAGILVPFDVEQSLAADSPEYYPYDPRWGRLPTALRKRVLEGFATTRRLAGAAKDARHQANLNWLADNFEFTLLLDEVGRKIELAYRLKDRWLRGALTDAELKSGAAEARQALAEAPVEKLFRTYARRVRSRGELGELSSINQRLGLQFRESQEFLNRLAEGIKTK